MKRLLIFVLPVMFVCTPVVCNGNGGAMVGTHDDVVYEYYDNGVLKSENNYANGVKNGKVFEYYPTGLRKQELTYKDGILNGRARWYDENGQLLANVRVKNGQIIVGHKYNADGTHERLTDAEIAEYQAKLP